MISGEYRNMLRHETVRPTHPEYRLCLMPFKFRRFLISAVEGTMQALQIFPDSFPTHPSPGRLFPGGPGGYCLIDII
jgi:hypothetical protein